MEEKIPVCMTAPRFELTSQRQNISRLPAEPPGATGIYTSLMNGWTSLTSRQLMVGLLLHLVNLWLNFGYTPPQLIVDLRLHLVN